MKGIGSGQSRAAEGQAGGNPRWPESQDSQEQEAFDLRTHIVGGMGVKKVHIP